jgi:tripartite-type tricarboxylate transporter receptor subunit TctC
MAARNAYLERAVQAKDIVEILRMPDVQQKHAEVGAEIVASTPEQFHAYLKSEMAKFGKLVKATGIKAASGG